ncbi:MAG: hypothetical protein ACFFCZ_20560 [Promethearchaeota archaeon]
MKQFTMIFKLYKTRYKAGHDSDIERFKEFIEFYKEYGVQIVGGGVNVDNPLENYLITTYRDKVHYAETVAKLQSDPKYQELTQQLQEVRESVEVTTLEVPDFLKGPLLNDDESLFSRGC